MTHHEHHHHEVKSELTFDEKLIKLLEHWLKHNDDHAGNYRDWAEKARQNQLEAVGALLEDAPAGHLRGWCQAAPKLRILVTSR